MIMSEKSKKHVDSCRFCWMCHHICPIGNATGLERDTAKARALGLSLVNRGALKLSDVVDNLYECATCGACVHDCTTGWDPVMFTKEARLNAAMEGELPEYINVLIDNCINTGNAYGITELDAELSAAMENHAEKTDILLFLGVDARYKVADAAVKAIKVLEKANVDFTVLKEEPASGQQLECVTGGLLLCYCIERSQLKHSRSPFGAVPYIGSQPVIEIRFMAHHENASLIGFQCTLQFFLGVYIQMVGRLVQKQHVGVTVDQFTQSYLSLFAAA